MIERYLEAIRARDQEGILRLFTPEARVVHPVFGELPVAEFYRRLLEATTSDRTSGETVFQGPDSRVALYFQDEWTSADGTAFRNPIVLIFDLADDGRARALEVVFDTWPFRGDHSTR